MGAVDKFSEATNILQQVDVTTIISSLALGIAEAQEKLDDNSVKQLIRLSEQEVAGKSLLELGFYPAFYAFDYADVSASINLKMALKTEVDVKLSLEYDSTRKKGYSNEQIDLFEKENIDSSLKEFKSHQSFWTQASNSHTLKVNEETIETSDKTESLSRLEETSERLSSNSEVERADYKVIETKDITNNSSSADINVHNYNGFGMVSNVESSQEDYGIVKIEDYTGINIDLSGTLTITNVTDKAGFLSEITGNNTLKLDFSDQDKIEIFFAFAKKDSIEFDYSEGLVDNAKDNNKLQKQLRALALIMIKDSSVKIKITGHTDSVSGTDFNLNLGEQRAKTVKNYLIALKVPSNQIIETISKGEELANTANEDDTENPIYRKVEIILTTNATDYIYIEGDDFNYGNSSAIATFSSSVKSGILYKKAADVATDIYNLDIQSDTDISLIQGVNNLHELNAACASESKLYSQISGDVVYLLRTDAKIQHRVYSSTKEDTSIVDVSTDAQNSTNGNSNLEIHTTWNREHYLKKDAEIIKDPKVSAWSGSLDARYARQFEMSVEGNAAVSARMKSLPAPQRFIDHIDATYNIGK